MERGSDTHGPRVDDELARETASLTHGAPIEARADDMRLQEDAGDDEPMPEPFIATEATDTGDAGEMPSYAAIRDRSELARHLRPSIYPATRTEIVICATEENAPDDLIDMLGLLPETIYRTT